MRDAVLLIAARCPVPGETKTRLGAHIGMEASARLYRAFLIDLARQVLPAVQTAGIDVVWTYSPPEADFPAVMREIGIEIDPRAVLPQEGDSWGARQDAIMRWAPANGYRRSVLIASDSPHLPPSHLLAAFDLLRDHEVAVGRVEDGGYYLIGMAGYHDVLQTVPMSTASAADALIANAQSSGCRVGLVPTSFDVDEMPDLDQLIAHLLPTGGPCPATWQALHDLGLAPAP